MDFYETSACTNLNIKEVRALEPSCPASLAESSRVGEAGGEGSRQEARWDETWPSAVTGSLREEEEMLG